MLSFDTWLTLLLNGSDNLYLDGVAMLATKPLAWIPLYLAIFYVLVREHDFKHFLLILGGLFLCVLVSDQISSSLVKPLVCRFRPSHDPSISQLVDVVHGYRGGYYGFFSSHASNTMAVAVFLSLIFRHKVVTWTFVAWSLINCWTRLYLGVHFFGDILVGLCFGAFVGTGFYLIYRKLSQDVKPITYSATRLSIIVNTFLLTLIIVTIPWKLYF